MVLLARKLKNMSVMCKLFVLHFASNMELFAKLLLKHIYRFGFTRVVNQETVV